MQRAQYITIYINADTSIITKTCTVIALDHQDYYNKTKYKKFVRYIEIKIKLKETITDIMTSPIASEIQFILERVK